MTRVHRRNFLPAVIIDILLWITCGLIVFLSDPYGDSRLSLGSFQLTVYPNIILFFVVLGFSLVITLALLFGNTRRGFLVAAFLVSVLILRLFKITNWGWIALAFILTVGIELFFVRKSRRQNKILQY